MYIFFFFFTVEHALSLIYILTPCSCSTLSRRLQLFSRLHLRLRSHTYVCVRTFGSTHLHTYSLSLSHTVIFKRIQACAHVLSHMRLLLFTALSHAHTCTGTRPHGTGIGKVKIFLYLFYRALCGIYSVLYSPDLTL